MNSLIPLIIILLIVGYLCGCLASGYLVGKSQGIDIRDYGSGNAGTTNVLRVLGKSKALITFLGDALKGFIPVLLMKYVIGPRLGLPENTTQLLSLLLGFAVVMGHDYPFYLHFKGGKGIATTAAIMTAFDWRFGLISFIIFAVIVSITRYVSLGSCLLSAALVIEFAIFYPGRWDLIGMAALYAFFAIYRHRANIRRLLNGTESKLGQKVDVNK
ncbi:MAG: glycerol-3-phosphate 1-O-acyltransferase PlsY [Eubacterium sp.]|nr:glycerol-3-phosphate 1-O-acyltransferase PlsY [Eubacterium sp.]